MKRYYTDNLSPGPVAPDDEVHCVVRASDLIAHMAKLKAVVEGMEHDPKCHSQTHCGVSGCNKPPWSLRHDTRTAAYYSHGFEAGKCNCPLSELRRGLEVMAGLKEMAK